MKLGGKFSGSEYTGGFTGRGLAGNYVVGDGVIIITTKNQKCVPDSIVRNKIESHFFQKSNLKNLKLK